MDWLRSKWGKKVKAGNVYVTQVSDGRYVAVRVLQVIERSWLVSTTPSLDEEPPSLGDPRLREILSQERFNFQQEPAYLWFEGKPPACFKLLGNVPPSDGETAIECSVYGGKWHESVGNEAFLEWRWRNDRPAFEAEVRERSEAFERQRREPQEPNVMMEEGEFWSVIDLLDWEHQGNDEKVLEPAVKALAAKTEEAICQFAERFAYLLYQLDTKPHASNMGEYSYDPETDYVSADGFLYARCAVLANGKGLYEAVLEEPTEMPEDLEFESLLCLTDRAYELKTGREYDYSTGCSFETFSNGAAWTDNR